MKTKFNLNIFLLLAFFSFAGTVHAATEVERIGFVDDVENKKPDLWIKEKYINSLSKKENDEIQKIILNTVGKQNKFHIVLPGNVKLKKIPPPEGEDDPKEKKKEKKEEILKQIALELNIKDIAATNESTKEKSFLIEAQLINTVDKKNIKKVSMINKNKNEILKDTQAALSVLFGVQKKHVHIKDISVDLKPTVTSRKSSLAPAALKRTKIKRKIYKEAPREHITSFALNIQNIKSDIQSKFISVKDRLLKEKKEQEKKQQYIQSLNMAKKLQAQQNYVAPIKSALRFTKSFWFETGMYTQDTTTVKATTGEADVATASQFQYAYLSAEYRREIFSNSGLDYLLGGEIGYPLTESESVASKKYTGLRAGLQYTLKPLLIIPIALSAYLNRINLVFATIPSRDIGVRNISMNTTNFTSRFALAFWENRISLWAAYETILSSSADDDNYITSPLTGTTLRMGLNTTFDYILENSTLAFQYKSTTFETTQLSEEGSLFKGTDNAYLLTVGYLY